MVLSNVKQKCVHLPPGSAVKLNKLNLIEIKLFIKMLYGVWFSLQPDHEANKSPHRMQVSPQARNDDRSPIWNIWRPHIFSLPGISTKDFPYIKGKIDWSTGINYSSVNFKWAQVFLCCQSSMRSQRSMNFLKRQVIQDKSKPTRDTMIWLRVKVNGTRLCTAVHFARNEIKYQKSRGNGLFDSSTRKPYAFTIACLSFICTYIAL